MVLYTVADVPATIRKDGTAYIDKGAVSATIISWRNRMTIPEIAIESKCAECSKNSHEPKPAECSYTHCELHASKPGKASDKIAAYCLWCQCQNHAEIKSCHLTQCALHPLRTA